MRAYIERFEADPARQTIETQAALSQLVSLSRSLAGIEARTGRKAPTVIT